MIANKPKVEILLSEMQPEILVCTEARITDDINDGEISIDGYNLIRCNSRSRHTAGIVVYVDMNVHFDVIDDIQFGNNNILAFEIKKSLFRGVWIAVYHSPNARHDEFVDRFKLCDFNL